MASNDTNVPQQPNPNRQSLLQRMSVLAGFDDMCRSEIGPQDEEKVVLELMRRCEQQRINYLFDRRELEKATERYEKAVETNKSLKAQIKGTRGRFAKEVQKQTRIKKENQQMSSSIKNIKEFVATELAINQTTDDTSQQLATLVNDMMIIEEETEPSLDGTTYDKSVESD